jgi:hypothetical protein
MSKLRRSARGKMCTLQIHPYCNSNPETVVLCHIGSVSKGVALKSHDHFGVYGCSDCHDVIDGRKKTGLLKEEILRCQMRALERTWSIMISEGLIKIT